MSLVNASDLSHSIVRETTFGVTPTATATRHELPLAADQEPLAASATIIPSQTMRPGRNSNGSRRGSIQVEGSLTTRFVSHAFMDLLLENALCGTFTTNVLRAGETDQSFSVISRFASDMFKTSAGCAVSGFTLTATNNDEVSISFDIMGSTQTNSATNNPLAVTAVTGTTEFIGSEVNTITIGGQTLAVAELTLSYTQDKTRRFALGSNNSLAYGFNGTREVTLSVKAYRDDFAIDSAITGLAQNCSFRIGGTGNGYQFELPSAFGDIPVDSIDDGSVFVDINFTAGFNNAANTSLVITKL